MTEYKSALEEARKIIAELPSETKAVLDAAHERYMCFSGVHDPEQNADHVAEDRTAFAHLLVYVDGNPSLSDERCADFMVAVTGLPLEWCLAWGESAFAAEHGDGFWDKQVKLQGSKSLEASNGLN